MEFLDLKLLGTLLGPVMHYSENLSINTMTKTFASKLISQGRIEQGNLSKTAKNFHFGGNFITISISVLNFSTDQLKKQQFFTHDIPQCNIFF